MISSQDRAMWILTDLFYAYVIDIEMMLRIIIDLELIADESCQEQWRAQ